MNLNDLYFPSSLQSDIVLNKQILTFTKCFHFSIAANAPAEIISRGVEALGAYNEAVSAGSEPVYRTRLMLVGQERVGKTSLVKNLLQLP